MCCDTAGVETCRTFLREEFCVIRAGLDAKMSASRSLVAILSDLGAIFTSWHPRQRHVSVGLVVIGEEVAIMQISGSEKILADSLFPMIITGASGVVGGAFVKRLAEYSAGRKVYLLGRRKELVARHMFAGAEFFRCDLAYDNFRAPFDVRSVVHIAGAKTDEQQMRAVNIEDTQRLLNSLINSPVSVFVNISSVGVYGAGYCAGLVAEEFPPKPRNVYERTKLDAEAILTTYFNAHKPGCRLVVLRPSNVLDFEDLGRPPLVGFMKAVCRGAFFVPVEDGTLNYISVKNVAAAVVAALSHKGASGVFNVNTPCSVSDAVNEICKRLERSHKPRRIPRRFLKVIGIIGDSVKAIGLASPVTSEKILEVTNKTEFSAVKFMATVGFEYPFSIVDEIGDCLVRYRKVGIL